MDFDVSMIIKGISGTNADGFANQVDFYMEIILGDAS